MDDTPPEVMAVMQEMLCKKTPSERAQMGVSMFLTSRQLVLETILRRNPEISSAALRQELLLKFYGEDFNLKEREAILHHLLHL